MFCIKHKAHRLSFTSFQVSQGKSIQTFSQMSKWFFFFYYRWLSLTGFTAGRLLLNLIYKSSRSLRETSLNLLRLQSAVMHQNYIRKQPLENFIQSKQFCNIFFYYYFSEQKPYFITFLSICICQTGYSSNTELIYSFIWLRCCTNTVVKLWKLEVWTVLLT